MRYTWLLWMLLIYISCKNEMNKTATVSAVDTSSIEDDIKAEKTLVTDAFDDIWSNLDSTKIKEYHTPDFLLLENGIVWNNDSVQSYLDRERIEIQNNQYQRLNKLDFLKSVHNHHSVWVAYHNVGTWIKEGDTLGSVHWLESAIAIKDQGKWKLQQLHSTRIE